MYLRLIPLDSRTKSLFWIFSIYLFIYIHIPFEKWISDLLFRKIPYIIYICEYIHFVKDILYSVICYLAFIKTGDDSILSLNIWSLPQNIRYFLFLFCLSLKKVFKNISYVKLSCRFYLSVCTWKHVNSIKMLHIMHKKLNIFNNDKNQFKRLAIYRINIRYSCNLVKR